MWLHFTGATNISLHKAENGNKSLQQASFCLLSLKLSGKYDSIAHSSLCILLNWKKIIKNMTSWKEKGAQARTNSSCWLFPRDIFPFTVHGEKHHTFRPKSYLPNVQKLKNSKCKFLWVYATLDNQCVANFSPHLIFQLFWYPSHVFSSLQSRLKVIQRWNTNGNIWSHLVWNLFQKNMVTKNRWVKKIKKLPCQNYLEQFYTLRIPWLGPFFFYTVFFWQTTRFKVLFVCLDLSLQHKVSLRIFKVKNYFFQFMLTVNIRLY